LTNQEVVNLLWRTWCHGVI